MRKKFIAGLLAAGAMISVPGAAMAADNDGARDRGKRITLSEVARGGKADNAPAKRGVIKQDSLQGGWVVIHSEYGNGGQCLDADATAGGNGTKVQAWDCNYEPQQFWYSTDDGYLVNGKFQNMCLDADLRGGGANGTKIQLWECNSTAQQRFFGFQGDKAIYNERFFNNGNTVLDRDVSGQPGNGDQAQLWAKVYQPQQWWWIEG